MQTALSSFARARFSRIIVQLCASLAMADGALSREEFSAFRVLFPMPPKRDLRVRAWLEEGMRAPVPPSAAGNLLLSILPEKEDLLEEILSRFVALAYADGALHEGELAWLRECCQSLRLPPEILAQLIEDATPDSSGGGGDPYALFGLRPDASLMEIKRSWQRQIRAFHPDALAAKGLKPEDQQRLGRRMTEINAAYDQILKQHGERH